MISCITCWKNVMIIIVKWCYRTPWCAWTMMNLWPGSLVDATSHSTSRVRHSLEVSVWRQETDLLDIKWTFRMWNWPPGHEADLQDMKLVFREWNWPPGHETGLQGMKLTSRTWNWPLGHEMGLQNVKLTSRTRNWLSEHETDLQSMKLTSRIKKVRSFSFMLVVYFIILRNSISS